MAAAAMTTPLLAAPPASAVPAFCNTAAGRAQYSMAVAWGECGPANGSAPAPAASSAPPAAPAINPPGMQPQIAALMPPPNVVYPGLIPQGWAPPLPGYYDPLVSAPCNPANGSPTCVLSDPNSLPTAPPEAGPPPQDPNAQS
jgi:hypothetical protein